MTGHKRIEVACLGETMAQVIPVGGDIERAERFVVEHGGAESNTAVGLARLGVPAAWISRLGDDALGRRLKHAISAEGVDVSSVVIDPTRPTGLFTKDLTGTERPVTYFRTNSAASVLDPTDLQRALRLAPTLLHSTGVTAALSEGSETTFASAPRLCREAQVTFSFDVNYRPILWNSRQEAATALAHIGQDSDLLFVGLDEAGSLWGTHHADELREMFPSPRIVIVKDAAHEAVAFADGQREAVPARKLRVVEPVGAGDGFAAGFIHGYLGGHSLRESLSMGHAVAGAVLSSRSDVGDREAVTRLARKSPGAKDAPENQDSRERKAAQ